MGARAIGLALCLGFLSLASSPAGQTEYVFLVTGDGIRHQELFTGADPELMKPENKKPSGIEDYPAMRKQFWAESPKERREKLMPFFWGTLAKEGVVLGNQALGSKVLLRNPHRFSYPGYAEILNGQYVEPVTSNDAIFSPRQTVLEFLKDQKGWSADDVAAFGSWKIFNWITMQEDGAIFCNAGYERMPNDILSERGKLYDQAQFDMLSPWDTVRHDVPTLELALEYLRARKPKCLYLALGETDDWAHNRRYDRVLQTARYFDDALKKLWTTLQSHPTYRGKSTLIITTDHGRGSTLENWTSHGKDIEGAQDVWIAIFGPDTPNRGELRDTPEYALGNIAATMLQFYGLQPSAFNSQAGPPIREAFAEQIRLPQSGATGKEGP